MKWVFLYIMSAGVALAATGDIVSVTVHSEGWKADVVVEGVGTGGMYNWGFGANNDPATGTPKVVFTVVSKGFDATGAATTISRTVYGTKTIRQAYPNEASLQESGSSPVTITIALSDYIYQKDATGAGNSGTAPTVSIGAGWYTQGTASNAVTGLAATNNSTREYPRPIAAWAHPDRDVVTGNTMTLRTVAFDRAARSGQPVRAVKYTVTDESADSVTATVTAATVDGGASDAVPVVEYIGTLDVSSLTQNDVLTANFQVFPWVGDTPLDSADAVNTNPSANYAPQKWLLDRTGGYGGSEAFVDPVSGTAGGAAVALGTGNEGSTAAFQTVLQAVNAIAARNNSTYSRNSTDRSIIYLKEGTHAGIGAGSITGGLTAQKTYLTIQKAPSAVRENVILTSGTGAWTIQQYLKLVNVTLGNSPVSSIITGHTMAWADQCFFNQTTSGARIPFYNNTLMYVTRSKVDNVPEGLMPYGAINATFALIRGNDFTNYENSMHAYCVIGNKRDHGAGTAQPMPIRLKSFTSTQPLPQHPIVAFNKFLTLSTSAAVLTEFWLNEAPPTGYIGTAVVQNLFEQVIAAGSPIIWLAADGCQHDVHNAIVWHNTSLGQRNNLTYNDLGSTARYRWNWSVQNNVADNWNIKTDTFAPPNGARVGNWANLYGVGYSGNVFAETSGVGAAGQFQNEFAGLKAIQGNGSAATTYLDFASRQAATGSNGSGNGSYTLGASSAARNMQSVQLLPYDLAGNERGATDASGAYTTYQAPPPPASTINATTTNATTVTIQ